MKERVCQNPCHLEVTNSRNMAPSRTATCFISAAKHLATKVVQLIHLYLHILVFCPSVLATTLSVLQTFDSYSYF
jgi:uncharacterized protein (DUF983 family)